MAFYALSDDHVLAMPIKRFWLLSSMIDRVQAMDAQRSLYIAQTAAAGGEAAKSEYARLTRKIGAIVTKVDVPDHNAINRLKALAGGRK
jgi:hypothetical protein